MLLEAKKAFRCNSVCFLSQLAARRNSLREKLKSFIVLAIFRKTKVFNGKFIIYASYILFFHMNNCSECKRESREGKQHRNSIQVLSETSEASCSPISSKIIPAHLTKPEVGGALRLGNLPPHVRAVGTLFENHPVKCSFKRSFPNELFLNCHNLFIKFMFRMHCS